MKYSPKVVNCDGYQVIWFDENVETKAVNVVYQQAFKQLGFTNLMCISDLKVFEKQYNKILDSSHIIIICSGKQAEKTIKIIKPS